MKFTAISSFLLYIISSFALAQAMPVDIVRDTSNEVITALQEHKATLHSNPQVVYEIVNKILLPRADLLGMARSVVPRAIWVAATPAQQQQFTREFTTLLVRTYSAALANYSDQTIEFPQSRGGVSGNFAQVRSKIIRPDGPPVEVDYQMILRGGQWKVLDFSVEGISMLESFRSQFATENNQGLTDLTARLAQHNESNQ